MVFLVVFVVYLEIEILVIWEVVIEIFGIELDWEKGFYLDVEDYFLGVLIFVSELLRLFVNSVIVGDYFWFFYIFIFINELDFGFCFFNLKNDFLRKCYDGLKYDVKKVEEVVYDFFIWGFNKEMVVVCVEK